MRDVFGNELKIDDIVATMFDDYSTLVLCRVVKFSPQKIALVLIEQKGVAPITSIRMKNQNIRYKFPSQVAKGTPSIERKT